MACFGLAVKAQDPEIVDEIWPEVQQVGRTGRLNCTVTNKQTNVVRSALSWGGGGPLSAFSQAGNESCLVVLCRAVETEK